MSVRLNGVISEGRNVNYGVPQGSILGPILFCIYVNDLPKHVNGMIVQYADDTQLLHTGKDRKATFKQCKSYFLSNGLLINPSKMHFPGQSPTQLIFLLLLQYTDGENILPSTQVKNLGVHFDRYMLYDVHLNDLQKKGHMHMNEHKRIGDCFDKSTRILVTQSLVLSSLYYCIYILFSTNDTLLCKAPKLQYFAAKVAVRDANKYDRVTPFFKELKFLRIKEKHVFDICTTVYKVLQRCYPEGFLSSNSVNDVTNSVTRERNYLYLPRTRSDSDSAEWDPDFWNDFPPVVNQAQAELQ